jgi:hypothetical protein
MHTVETIVSAMTNLKRIQNRTNIIQKNQLKTTSKKTTRKWKEPQHKPPISNNIQNAKRVKQLLINKETICQT